MPTAQPPPGNPENHPSEAGGTLFPVGAVASRLGVSTSTLRAWERRYGLAPSARTAGGHRRYSGDDLERLRRMRELLRVGMAAAEAAAAGGASHPTPLRAVSPPQLTAQRLTEAMHRLDADAISALATATLQTMGAATAWTAVFMPALIGIGEHWEATGCGVEVEHLTTGILESALRRHIDRRLTSTGPVLLAAAPGEGHTIPLTALAAALADADTTTLLIGALPAQALLDALARLQPEVTVLWARSPDVADTDWLKQATVSSPGRVHPAGPGWPTVQGHEHLPDLANALRTLLPPERTIVPGQFHHPDDLWPTDI